ncbi:MAG: hypothetical protein ABW217_03260, partial [Polyangiaceae bacterium]
MQPTSTVSARLGADSLPARSTDAISIDTVGDEMIVDGDLEAGLDLDHVSGAKHATPVPDGLAIREGGDAIEARCLLIRARARVEGRYRDPISILEGVVKVCLVSTLQLVAHVRLGGDAFGGSGGDSAWFIATYRHSLA